MLPHRTSRPFHPAGQCRPQRRDGRGPQDRRLKDEWDIKAVGTFPVGCTPQVPIDSPLYYPIYSTCGAATSRSSCAGVPAPPADEPQLVERIDQVMYDFPELTS